MKTILLSLFALLFISISYAQCNLSMSISVDGSGNIVTTNNSTNAEPSGYYWYVYNLDLSPNPPYYLEHIENSVNLSYAPMSVANYMICLIGTEVNTNNACDSICDTLIYTQSMMNLQNSAAISELESSISVYPIPAKSVLNVELNTNDDSEFTISDAFGRNFDLDRRRIGNRWEISISELPAGIYFLTSRKLNKTVRFFVE